MSEAFMSYLSSSYSTVSAESVACGVALWLEEDEFLEEVPLASLGDLVWPKLFHDGEGGLIVHWVTGSRHVRVSQLDDAWLVKVWDDSDLAASKKVYLMERGYLHPKLVGELNAMASLGQPGWKAFITAKASLVVK